MATFRAIEATAALLRDKLAERFEHEFGSEFTVKLATPREFAALEASGDPALTIFLYQVEENRDLRNQPRRRELQTGKMTRPLVVDLRFLITPWAKANDGDDQDAAALEGAAMLGLALQTLAPLGEIVPASIVAPIYANVFAPDDSVQLMLESLPVEELYRIWDSSELPFRLSIAYRVRVIGIEHETQPGAGPVNQAELVAGQSS